MPESVYRIAIEATALLSLWVGLGAWQRDRRAPAGYWFLGLISSVLCWCLGEILSPMIGVEARNRVVYAGALTVPPLWVAMAAHAARVDLARRMPWFPIALMTPGLFLYLLLYLGPWSGLFLEAGESRSVEGPLFRISTLYNYALVVTGMVLLGVAASRWSPRGHGRRIAALAIGVLIPLAGNAIYLFGDLALAHDPTPVLLGLAAIPLRGAIFGTWLFDVLPVDQRNILGQLPIALVLADDSGCVVEINPAAEERLRITRREAQGRALEAVLAGLPPQVPLQIVPIHERGSRAQCAVIGETNVAAPGDPLGAAPAPLLKIS